MRRLAKAKPQREPTIALINIVFLMLVFFMIAGTLAAPPDPRLTLVQTRDLQGQAPGDALLVFADGRLEHQGRPVADAAAFVGALPVDQRDVLRIMPDQALPARQLVALIQALQAAGGGQVILVSQRAIK